MSDTDVVGVEACMMFEGMEDVVVPCRFVKKHDFFTFMFNGPLLHACAIRHSYRFGMQGVFHEDAKQFLRAFFPIHVQGHGWIETYWLVIRGLHHNRQKFQVVPREAPTFLEEYPKGAQVSAATIAFTLLDDKMLEYLESQPPKEVEEIDMLGLMDEMLSIYVERGEVPVTKAIEAHTIPLVCLNGVMEGLEEVHAVKFPDASVLLLKPSGMLAL